MQNTIQRSKLCVSFYPAERWVISGENNETISSDSKPDEVKEFCWKNGVFPGMEKEAFKNAARIDFRFSEPTKEV